jgi:hypothetical protein
MTQLDLLNDDARMFLPVSYTERVAKLFLSRPTVWIDGLEIARIAGAYAWRSRISDARREFGLNIVNRQRRIGSRVFSEYRYVPVSCLTEEGRGKR